MRPPRYRRAVAACSAQLSSPAKAPACLPARLRSLDSCHPRRRCACDVRPAQIRVRNAEVVLLAGGDESAAGDGAADGAADVAVKDDAAQTLDNSQMSCWVYSPVTQALANLIVDINGLTFQVEMLRRVPAEIDPATAAAGGASAAAALEPQRPRHAERQPAKPERAGRRGHSRWVRPDDRGRSGRAHRGKSGSPR
jgi:hypothetical protein